MILKKKKNEPYHGEELEPTEVYKIKQHQQGRMQELAQHIVQLLDVEEIDEKSKRVPEKNNLI